MSGDDKKLSNLRGYKILLHEERGNPTQVPQDVMHAPVEQNVHHYKQELLPDGTVAWLPVLCVAQAPGSVS